MPVPSREDTYNVTVNIEGRDFGLFDQSSGGELDSEENLYNPGGMLGQISIGGLQTIGNVTTERYVDPLRDWALMGWAQQRRGWARASISLVPRDPQGVIRADPATYSGTLKTVNYPETDSTGTDMAKWSMEFTVDGFTAPAA